MHSCARPPTPCGGQKFHDRNLLIELCLQQNPPTPVHPSISEIYLSKMEICFIHSELPGIPHDLQIDIQITITVERVLHSLPLRVHAQSSSTFSSRLVTHIHIHVPQLWYLPSLLAQKPLTWPEQPSCKRHRCWSQMPGTRSSLAA